VRRRERIARCEGIPLRRVGRRVMLLYLRRRRLGHPVEAGRRLLRLVVHRRRERLLRRHLLRRRLLRLHVRRAHLRLRDRRRRLLRRRLRRRRRLLLLRCGSVRHLAQLMHEPERRRDRFERLRHRGMRGRLRLKLRERATNVIQRDVRMRRELIRSFDLVERAHRLRDRGGELHQVLRDTGICLERVEPLREVLPSCFRRRKGIAHGRDRRRIRRRVQPSFRPAR
jgi:hypothetical protein